MVNAHGFTESERVPDPTRLLGAYHQSASTINLMRAFTGGGFADLRLVHEWNRGFIQNPAHSAYESMAAEIGRALGEGSGGTGGTGGTDPAAGVSHDAVDAAVRELFDAGVLMPDSFAAVRARLAGTGITDTVGSRGGAGASAKGAHKAPRRNRGRGSAARLRMGRTTFAQTVKSEEVRARRAAMNAHAGVPGRWSLVPAPGGAVTDRAIARGEAWLDRYAVVTRGSVMAEHTEGGFAAAYRMLTAWEDNGTVLRGYIIDGLGGAQFASREVIDRLRQLEEEPPAAEAGDPVVLAAADPANPFGAAVPWPETGDGGSPEQPEQTGHSTHSAHSAHPAHSSRPTRAAGALVVIRDGVLLAHLTRGGRHVQLFSRPNLTGEPGTPDPADVAAVVGRLRALVQDGRLSPVAVEKVNGTDVMSLPPAARRAWTEAGARFTPKGLVVR
jgi:ATP-dependent Lhr-like helicase